MKFISTIGKSFNTLQEEGLDKELDKILGDKKVTFKSQYQDTRNTRLENLLNDLY